eukprot:PhM_4_TR14692/c1_g2_i4/m.68296
MSTTLILHYKSTSYARDGTPPGRGNPTTKRSMRAAASSEVSSIATFRDSGSAGLSTPGTCLNRIRAVSKPRVWTSLMARFTGNEVLRPFVKAPAAADESVSTSKPAGGPSAKKCCRAFATPSDSAQVEVLAPG